MKVIAYVCDVCGGEVNQSRSYWSQTILINGEVYEEYSSPPNLDLCDEHIQLFGKISSKWKQERYDTYDLTKSELQDLVNQLKSLEDD